jgi:curved DNA-binding protein CbpA
VPLPDTQAIIFSWLTVLDELTYYELFGISSEAKSDEVREAFHEFCDSFHPDRHISRSLDERRAVATIFKRGTEAYLVLSDHVLRGHYDSQLAVRPDGRPQRMTARPLSRPPPSIREGGGLPLDEAARSSAARPFARRAEELIKKGDLRQAKLQLVMANHRDPGNEILEAALRDIEAKIR